MAASRVPAVGVVTPWYQRARAVFEGVLCAGLPGGNVVFFVTEVRKPEPRSANTHKKGKSKNGTSFRHRVVMPADTLAGPRG